jgi:hypothetical protein
MMPEEKIARSLILHQVSEESIRSFNAHIAHCSTLQEITQYLRSMGLNYPKWTEAAKEYEQVLTVITKSTDLWEQRRNAFNRFVGTVYGKFLTLSVVNLLPDSSAYKNQVMSHYD